MVGFEDDYDDDNDTSYDELQMPEELQSDRIEIIISTEEYIVNMQALEALAKEPDIYQYAGMLVTVVTPDSNADDADADSLNMHLQPVRPLVKPLLRERLSKNVRWVRCKVTNEGLIKSPESAPGWMLDALSAYSVWPGIPYLKAIAHHPVLLPDGSLLCDSRYDPASKLFLSMPPGMAVSVPEQPTRDDVASAVAVLEDVIQDFPFETPSHKAAWFAALLTPLAWFSFDGPAPLFLIDANVRGAGKGLLADTIALIITGKRFSIMSYTNDKEELRKKITSLAMHGSRYVLFDNLTGDVGNEVLDRALTGDEWEDRILGGNRNFVGKLNMIWYATGNNVQLSADTSRRVCHIRLDSMEERPEYRDDVKHKDLRQYVRDNREKLLVAALTILRGYVVAGKPKHGLKPWGSFEPWSNLVREAIVFAGLPDPGETREQLQATADRDAIAMSSIIAGMEDLDPNGRGLAVNSIVKQLADDTHLSAPLASMRCAILELCDSLNANSLAMKFREFKKRNFGGKQIDVIKSKQGTNQWGVSSVAAGRIRKDPTDSDAALNNKTSPSATNSDRGDGGDRGNASVQIKWYRRSTPDEDRGNKD